MVMTMEGIGMEWAWIERLRYRNKGKLDSTKD